MKCTLIIPTYNEAPVIADTLRELVRAFEEQLTPLVHEWNIIVADNASVDGTADTVRSLNDSRVSVCELTEKGKGRAVRAGFRMAEGAVVGFTDADLAVPPDEIVQAFLLVIEGTTSLVIGSRAHPQSVQPNREWWRMGSSQLFNTGVRIGVGVSFRDTQCPLKVMNSELRDVFFLTRENTWFFDFEFLALVERLGFSVTEVPVTWNEHRYPTRKSKLSTTRDGLRSLAAIFRIRRGLSGQVAKFRETFSMRDTMKWIIIGLGNPGGEYARTRHNAGRVALESFRTTHGLPNWEYKKPFDALISRGNFEEREVLLVEPETFMNESGKSISHVVKSPEQAGHLIVIHDDIDLPLGEWKISFDRGSGGHNGIKSLMATMKTNAFLRVRIGIAPKDEFGKSQKPKGEEEVSKFVLGKFRPEEQAQLEAVLPQIVQGISSIITDGKEVAMNKWNMK